MNDLDFLRRLAADKLPFLLTTRDDFTSAQALKAAGYIKLTLPAMRHGKSTYGKQDPARVVAITPNGMKALAA